tara:strand:- start:615 stop:1262 length:648 start_codon:yes stop_codon:yes gene_type:complete
MSFVSQYGGNLETGKNTGMKGINAALAAGMTINEIRDQLRKEGVQTGTKATEFLAARPSKSFISQYGGNLETMAHSGLRAVKAAEAAGLSSNQIQRMASAQGITFGSGAQEYFKNQQEASVENKFATQIATMQDMFAKSMQQQQTQYEQMQKVQEERMAVLRQQIQQAQGAQQQRPAVAGVKMAEGTGGTAMQIARRGIGGAFGRRGMRISGLNV